MERYQAAKEEWARELAQRLARSPSSPPAMSPSLPQVPGDDDDGEGGGGDNDRGAPLNGAKQLAEEAGVRGPSIQCWHACCGGLVSCRPRTTHTRRTLRATAHCHRKCDAPLLL